MAVSLYSHQGYLYSHLYHPSPLVVSLLPDNASKFTEYDTESTAGQVYRKCDFLCVVFGSFDCVVIGGYLWGNNHGNIYHK